MMVLYLGKVLVFVMIANCSLKRYFHETCSQLSLARENVGLIAALSVVILHTVIWHESALTKSGSRDRKTAAVLIWYK